MSAGNLKIKLCLLTTMCYSILPAELAAATPCTSTNIMSSAAATPSAISMINSAIQTDSENDTVGNADEYALGTSTQIESKNKAAAKAKADAEEARKAEVEKAAVFKSGTFNVLVLTGPPKSLDVYEYNPPGAQAAKIILPTNIKATDVRISWTNSVSNAQEHPTNNTQISGLSRATAYTIYVTPQGNVLIWPQKMGSLPSGFPRGAFNPRPFITPSR